MHVRAHVVVAVTVAVVLGNGHRVVCIVDGCDDGYVSVAGCRVVIPPSDITDGRRMRHRQPCVRRVDPPVSSVAFLRGELEV